MFIPRQPVVENQFCKYGETATAGGAGNVICYAGSVVYLDSTATNQEAVVLKMAYGISDAPFGFAMQKVKTGYQSVHPVGMMLPGDLGSSDVVAAPKYNANGTITGTAATPIGVAHMGIYDTVHYTTAGGAAAATAMLPGEALYPASDEAKVTNSTVNSDATDDAAGERCSTTVVARVVTGVSAAKASATINNTTLYPVKIKLLI